MTRLRKLSVAALLTTAIATTHAFAQETAAPASGTRADSTGPTDSTGSAGSTAPDDAAAAVPAPAPEAAVAAIGTLSLTTDVAGKVFLDGADTGLTTPVVDLPVAVGSHSVKVVTDDGREVTQVFTMEAGGSLSLSLVLPEAASGQPAAATTETSPAAPAAEAAPAPAAEAAPAPPSWSWMTVAGWTGVGLGTISVLSGSVVLNTRTDPDQGPLGFGLFGAGVGLVLGGGVLLYLDNELREEGPAAVPTP